MEGRLTPVVKLTKPDRTDWRYREIINHDLDLLDQAIGSIAGGGMSNPMTSAGDLIVGGTSGLPTRLGIGTSGLVLSVVAGAVTWATPAGGTPSGPAGGDLSGTYPNPQILAGTIVDTDVAAANKDGVAAAPSLRTLGTGAQQAAAGNHAHQSTSTFVYRFSTNTTMADPGSGQFRLNTGLFVTVTQLAIDTVTDAGTDVTNVLASLATGDQIYIQTQADSANWARHRISGTPTNQGGWFQIPVEHVTSGGSAPTNNTPCLVQFTLGAGGSGTSGVPVHAVSHQPGGTDPMAVDAAAGTGSLRTIGGGALQASAGNHAHAGSMTNPMTTAQDVIVGGASGTPARLGVGANTQVLTVTGGVVGWAAPVSGGMTNPMTTLGDVITGATAGAPQRLGVGTTDQVLRVLAGAPAWAAPAATASFLVNGGFEVWARGSGPYSVASSYTADRWQINLGASSTISVTRDSANADAGSQYCAAVGYTHAVASYLQQVLEEAVQHRGRTLTATMRVKVSTAGAVRLALYDGSTFAYSAYHSGSGAYETLTATGAVSASTSQVRVMVALEASCTAYVDSAVLVVGAAAPAYAPLTAADDLARCQRYYETLGGVSIERFALLQCWSTTRANGVLAWRVPKAATPTVVASAAGNFGLQSAAAAGLTVTALAFGAISPRSCDVDATVGSGLVAGNATLLVATNALALIAIEANPP